MPIGKVGKFVGNQFERGEKGGKGNKTEYCAS